MKRRTARQLVRLLSDIRHSTNCTALRAVATNRAIELADAEAAQEQLERELDGPDTARENAAEKPNWRTS